MVNFKKLKLKMIKEHIFKNVIDIWIKDPIKNKYDKIVFDPEEKNNNINYNMWKGFKFDDKIEPVKEEDSKFLTLLKNITVDNKIYEYIKQWIAHIIQKSYKKTNVAIILYSDTKGIGKNCIIEGIKKLLYGYTAHMLYVCQYH